MRKIATLLAATAIATVMLVAGSSAVSPSSAEAAACKWKLPAVTNISQRNGYNVVFAYNRTRGAWVAKYGTHDNFTISSEVEFTSVTPRLVRFIITWTDERSGLYTGTGIYTGTIDRDGFVTGTTRDRFNSSSKASWYMTSRARCV